MLKSKFRTIALVVYSYLGAQGIEGSQQGQRSKDEANRDALCLESSWAGDRRFQYEEEDGE